MRKKVCLLFVAGFILFLFANNGFTQDAEVSIEEVTAGKSAKAAKLIKIIRVEGNSVISSAAILSKVKSKPGDEFSSEILNDDLKRLYALGYFTDVAIDIEDYADGAMITFIVKEKPLIAKIEFEGNKAIRDAHLHKLMKTKEGVLLNHTQLNDDLAELRKFYEQKGFPGASVTYETRLDEETNQTILTISVNEKARVRIKDVAIKGNTAFAGKHLLKMIRTRKDTLFTSGFLKEDVFDEDLRRIKDLYHNSGYLDAEVSHQREYSDDGKFLYIVITVDEGRKYLVGAISIKGNIVFPEKELRNRLSMIADTPFSHQGLRYDIFAVQQFYYHKGYMFANVDADTIFNENTGRVDVLYKVKEREITYIDKVKIRGNTKTKDIVIRRELRVYPGEQFDGDKIRRSKERLYNLGYFEEVNFDTEPSQEPDRQNLMVEVKEAKTGEFSFGGGYSSVDALIGFAEILQKNFDWANPPSFTGDGQKLRIRAQFGSVRQDYELGWVEPWIFDYPLLFGFDIYQRTHRRKGRAGYGYEEVREGFDTKLGKEFTEYTRGDLVYKLEEVDISDVPGDSSSDLRDEEGKNVLSTLEFILTHDKRDNTFNPTKGYLLRGSVENGGGFLGADKDFFKYTGMGNMYFTHFGKLLLELRVMAGFVNEYDTTDKVPIYERFYAGGANSIRGYRERRIGPKDSATDDPLGGESVLVAGAEYTFPLVKDAVKGAVFYDVGNVWEKASDFASGDYKSSTGVGVRVKTPIGPVKLDWGYPLDEIPGEDKKGRFHFSITRGF